MKSTQTRREFTILLITMLLANIGARMWIVFEPLYLQELGADVVGVGLFFTLTTVLHIVFRFVGGWFSDRIGRLVAIGAGSLFGLIGFILLGLAPVWYWAFLAAFFLAAGRSLVGPSFDAYVAEWSSEETRARTFGRVRAQFRFVELLGPALGGAIIGSHNYRVVFMASGGLMGIATTLRLWLAWRGRRQGRVASPRPHVGFGKHLAGLGSMIFAGGLLTWLFLLDGILDVGASFSGKLQPIYLQAVGGLSESTIGILASLAGLAGIVAAWLSGRLGERWGERTAMVISLLATAGGWTLMLASNTVVGFGGAAFLWGFGSGMADPAWKSLISRAVPSASLGVTYAAFESTARLLSLPFPWIGAQLWEQVNPRLPFMVTIAITLLATIPVWLTFEVPSRSQ